MRISDLLAKKQTFSYEIFPPKGELSVSQAATLIDSYAPYKPDYVSVTFSAGGTGNSAHTSRIAERIQIEHPEISALAHMTCTGASRQDIDARMEALVATKVQNVLALRGDRRPGETEGDFAHAQDLIAHLRTWDICIGAACYPEGHVECDNFQLSMERLKAKQDAGADFFVTQLFFDNELYYRFREQCDRHRIKIPIVVGIMPFTSVKQVQRMAFTCGATIPATLIKRLVATGDDPDDIRQAGIEYACHQLEDLAANGVDGLHIYSMNRVDVARATHDVLAACGYLR